MDTIQKIYLVCTTLAYSNISRDQKIDLALQLQKLNIDFLYLSKKDPATSDIANNLKEIGVIVDCGPFPQEIESAMEVIKSASKSRIRINLKYDFYKDLNLGDNKIKNDLIKHLSDAFEYTFKLNNNVEFVIEDYYKIHQIYLYRLVESAIESKVNTITLRDSKGTVLTTEYGDIFKNIIDNLPDFEDRILGASCNNRLNLATASTLNAILNGARQIEVNLLHTDNQVPGASLFKVLLAFKERKDQFKVELNINYDYIDETLKFMESVTA